LPTSSIDIYEFNDDAWVGNNHGHLSNIDCLMPTLFTSVVL
jgi:hypothetical protein